MTFYLDLEALLLLTRKLGVGPVRDAGLLESALARPQATVFGVDAYPSIDGKAAALLHSLCRNHALVDGNKRLSWFATTTFLALNGLHVDMADDAAYDLVITVAEGRFDVEQIMEALAPALRPRP